MKTALVPLALLAASTLVSAGTIEGRVTLPSRKGPAPKPRYPVAATYDVGAPDPPAAIVYLEGDGATIDAEHAAVMAQEEYQFDPGLLAVTRGTSVAFPNRDDDYHSVFSYSKSKRFDLGRYRKDESPPEITFDEVGVVRLYCEIHDHMRGTILVLETPYHTKTDPSGAYRLEGVPAGSHVVRAWIDEDTAFEKTVQVGGTVTLDFP